MNRFRILSSALGLVALAASIRPAAAAWPHEPNNGNVALCTAANSQSTPTIISDGAGGAIVTWYDFRNGTNYDIYAQRISAAGVPLWTANGVPLCTATGDQGYPAIVSDGAGGAIITWSDKRSITNWDIYTQRISAAGATQWTANGVALCSAAGDQASPTIVSDGAGGAIVTWGDYRSGTSNDVYAQRINAAGAPQWTANGVALCTATFDQLTPKIASDGAGGAIVTWYDSRSATNYDIYAQRISAAGATQWTANGVALCTAANSQSDPTIISDGVGGAIVTWYDFRSPGSDIYAQRISAAGAPQWTANGVALCTAVNNQSAPAVISDGAGGAIATWSDFRGTSNDIYAQRISAAGVPQWTADGVALCTATGEQSAPMIVSDAGGGAIVTWHDYRSGTNYDIYAQRISAAGTPQWTWDGVALCAAMSDQYAPTIAPDGGGGAIVTWQDVRSGDYDIYAQRIERFGFLGNPEPVSAGVRDVPNDQGGRVKLSWSASYLDVDPVYGVFDYVVWRSVPPSALTAQLLLARGATHDAAEAAADGRYLILTNAGADYYWESVATQMAAGLAGYSIPVATLSDSIAASNPRTAFMVEARSSTYLSSPHWFSAPDSGYSVDNLPPAVPAPFVGQYAAGTTSLHWNRNTEADLAGYRLYRGTSVGFTPGPGNLLAALPDTGYADAAGAPYIYKLTAIDSHGNESLVATLIPSGTVGVADAAPLALSFAAPSPNPARGAATLNYTLSRAGHVQLSVYDAAGRRVQVVRDGELPAGAHRESYLLRDETGRDLASGLYLVRLEAEGRVLTRRLIAIR